MRKYRADQLGSFLRPRALLDAREQHGRGEIADEDLHQVEDHEILALLRKQQDIGVDVFSDGEFRRASFVSELQNAFAGRNTTVGRSGNSPLNWHGGDTSQPRQPASRVALHERPSRLSERETAFMQKHAPGPFKITLPSPIQATRMLHPDDKPGDPARAKLLADAVGLLRGDVDALVEDGVPYIQMDGPRYACYLDDKLRQDVIDAGIDADAVLDECIAAENQVIGRLHPQAITTAFHVCRGNGRSQWYAEGGYDAFAERLFNSLNVDAFLLEYDTPRSGGFEPLRFMPRGKLVVLGLVSTKGPEMESQDDLLRRIEEASHYIPLDDLALSPQCGFASLLLGNLLSEAEQWRKIELVVDTARKVWG